MAGYAYVPSAGNRTDAILWTYAPDPDGDINCDGVVNAADATALAVALVNPAAFTLAYPGCDISHADVSLDTLIDGRDIAAWLNLLP